MPGLPGRELAQELIGHSRAECRASPFEAVIAAAGQDRLDDDAATRLIGRLWTLERMFYYIYGGWGQGLEMNDFPGVEPEKCTGCGDCLGYCPAPGALVQYAMLSITK